MEAEIERYIQILRNAKLPSFKRDAALEFYGYIRALYQLRKITGEKFIAITTEYITPALDTRVSKVKISKVKRRISTMTRYEQRAVIKLWNKWRSTEHSDYGLWLILHGPGETLSFFEREAREYLAYHHDLGEKNETVNWNYMYEDLCYTMHETIKDEYSELPEVSHGQI